MRKKCMAGAKSGFDSIISFDHQLFFKRKVFGFERVLETLKTGEGIADFERTADETDSATAGSGQMADGIVCTLIVVGDDGIFGELGIGAHHEHERDARV